MLAVERMDDKWKEKEEIVNCLKCSRKLFVCIQKLNSGAIKEQPSEGDLFHFKIFRGTNNNRTLFKSLIDYLTEVLDGKKLIE